MVFDLELIDQRIKDFKDEELRKIIYIDYKDYDSKVIEIAKIELKTRFSKDIWEEPCTILKDLLHYADRDNLEAIFLSEFNCSISRTREYIQVYQRLLELEPLNQNDTIILIESDGKLSSRISNRSYIVGEDKKSQEKIHVQYCTWKEWLGFTINNVQLQNTGIERYVAHCIISMTEYGFDDMAIKNEFEKIAEGVEITNHEHPIEYKDIMQNNSITIDKVAEKGKELKDGLLSKHKDYQTRPWVRYWARSIDIMCWYTLIWVLELLILPNQILIWFNSLAWGMVSSFILFTLWSFIEALLLSRWGFTIGKWLLYTQVVDISSGKLSYIEALKRVWGVYVFGEGFQIPFLSVITNIISYNRLTKQGRTKWDQDGQYIVLHRRIESYKVIIAIILLVGIPILRFLTYKANMVN